MADPFEHIVSMYFLLPGKNKKLLWTEELDLVLTRDINIC